MNQEIVKQPLEQLQQEDQDPEDIGKVSIINVMLWMKSNAFQIASSLVFGVVTHLSFNW